MLSYIHKMNIKNSSNRFGELSHVEGGAALNNQNKIQKYDICEVALPQAQPGSSIQGGTRPVVIVSNNKCNQHSPVVSIVPLTSKPKRWLPTHVDLRGFGLTADSTALCEQITSIDRNLITRSIGHITSVRVQDLIDHALRVQIAA